MNPKETKLSNVPKFEHPQPQSMQPSFGQVDGYNPDLATLNQQVIEQGIGFGDKIKTHIHNGTNAPRINLNTDILGMLETVSTAPTAVPTSIYEQVKIYTNGATLRFYWFDVANNTWHYVTATA